MKGSKRGLWLLALWVILVTSGFVPFLVPPPSEAPMAPVEGPEESAPEAPSEKLTEGPAEEESEEAGKEAQAQGETEEADGFVWQVENDSEVTTEAPGEEASGKKKKKKKKNKKAAEESLPDHEEALAAFLAGSPADLLPLEDGSGCLISSDGVCTHKDGSLHQEAAVHYLSKALVGGEVLSGFLYHDAGGIFCEHEEPVELSGLTCRGETFTGEAYSGKLGRMDVPDFVQVQPDLGELLPELERACEGFEGTWSLNLRVLDDGQEIAFGEEPMESASLIKLFVMEAFYASIERAMDSLGKKRGVSALDPAVLDELYALLENMVTYSDNESYNELVRLLGKDDRFLSGSEAINAYLSERGYESTRVGHTLHPSESEEEGDEEGNRTSAADCALLLQRVREGAAAGDGACRQMLRFLLWQDNDTKIRTALPEGILSANKTGETDSLQHDAAILYGKECTAVLVILSSGCPEDDAIDDIRLLTGMVGDFWQAREGSG